jgi:hypothetical protein
MILKAMEGIMKKLACNIALLFALLCVVGQARQTPLPNTSHYPNELPGLKLYQSARWKQVVPHVSTRAEVERILGEPEPIYDQRFYDAKSNDYLVGYDYDADWIVIITYMGEYGDSRHLAGRVSDVRLYPKKRVSMRGVKFPPDFLASRTWIKDRSEEYTDYSDKFGLYYSIYAKDSPDGQHLAGDLRVIGYRAPDEEEGVP